MKKEMTITISDDSSVAYVRFAKGKVVRTLDLSEDLNLDLGADDKALGLEFLALNADLPEQRLIDEFHIDPKVVGILSKGLLA